MWQLKNIPGLGLCFYIFWLYFGVSAGFFCYQCSSATDRANGTDLCQTDIERFSMECDDGNVREADLCIVRYQKTPHSRFDVFERRCDSRSHARLKDGCTEFSLIKKGDNQSTGIQCICSEENCNGLSKEQIEAEEILDIDDQTISQAPHSFTASSTQLRNIFIFCTNLVYLGLIRFY